MNKNIKKITAVLILVLLSAAAGCKKDKSEDQGYNVLEIYGTAAVGAAITGTVNIKGSDGRLASGPVRTDGSYTIPVDGIQSPYILFVDGNIGGTVVRLYSTIDMPGRANITPATNLILALALGNDPETVYPPVDVTTDGVVIQAPPPQADIEQAKARVQAILENVFSVNGIDLPSGFDVMNGEFLANGSGFDMLLELLSMEVETNDSGEVVVSISDSISGTPYYVENTATDVIVDNTAGMSSGLYESAEDMAKIETVVNEWLSLFMTSDEAQRRAILQSLFAEDYLDEGMDKSASIDNEISRNSGFTVDSGSVTALIMAGAVEDTSFNGSGVFTITADRTIPFEGTTVTIPAGTVFTFNSGAMCSLAGSNYKTARVIVTGNAVMSGTSQVFNEVMNLVQPAAGGAWKLWGDRALTKNNFNTEIKRSVYASNATGTWIENDIKISGYSLHFNDESNIAYYKFGTGKEINAVLVTGEGMLRNYTDDGKKGILLIRFGLTGTEYIQINIAGNQDWQTAEYCLSGRDLDVSQITSPVLKVTAMHFDAAAKTLTPVYSWRCNWEGAIPLSADQLTDDLFSTFSFTSTYLYDYRSNFGLGTFPNLFPWYLPFSWIPPSRSGLSFSSLYCWVSGMNASGMNRVDEGIKLLESPTAVSPTSFNFSIPAAGTQVSDLRQIVFSLRYAENSAGKHTEYATEYQIGLRKFAVEGTITLPLSVANKYYIVAIDTDADITNGCVNIASGFLTGSTINYSIPNGVPSAGSYYLYCIVYGIAVTPGAAMAGDYIGFYGGYPPTGPNLILPSGGYMTGKDFTMVNF